MAENGSIQLEGLQDILRGLGAKRVEINREASLGLRKAGLAIIADAQRNLNKNHSWVTGLLANSGRVIYGGQGFDTGSTDARTSREASDSLMKAAASDADLGLDVGFFDNTSKNPNGYAKWVEYGRPAGAPPPLAPILTWLAKKFHSKDVVWANNIRWHIAWYGTKPRPFFQPAVDKHTPNILRIITDAVRKVVNK